MSKPKPLSVDLIRIDGDTQSRIKINDDTIDEYYELIGDGEWPFPPLDVFHDGTDYFLADGFHRILAAERAKRGSVPCVIHRGGARDARIFGMTANDRHGLRMSRADKRACVEWLLDQPGKMSQKEIAEKAGVTSRTVKSIVAERNPLSVQGKVKFAPDGTTGGGEQNGSTSAPIQSPKQAPITDDEADPFDVGEDVEDDTEADFAKARSLAHQYRDKLARAICDCHDHKPNREKRDELVKLVQSVEVWK